MSTAPNEARNLIVQSSTVTATSACITWDGPLTGVYDGFVIRVVDPGGIRREAGRVRGNINEYCIDGLDVNTQYTVELAALAGYNSDEECPSEPITGRFTTGKLNLLNLFIQLNINYYYHCK